MDEQQEKQFAKGFNSGYIIAKYLPDLAKTMTKDFKPTTDYMQGFLCGTEELSLERGRELRTIRGRGKGKERELGKDL